MKTIEFVAPLFTSPEAKAPSEAVLRLLLEALTQANSIYLAEHPDTPPLYASGVRYAREPLGQEVWQGIVAARAAGVADCEDLACWLAAEYRQRGIAARPVFYSRMRNGLLIYHIVVMLPNGSIEDPSRMLGMGGPP